MVDATGLGYMTACPEEQDVTTAGFVGRLVA